MTLTVGSLFSGIGGLDLGLERAGMNVIWQSEIDPYACKVLAKHWPEVPNHGNIKEINWGQVVQPDVICGGYPCQPFSTAGKRRGEDDPRHLWPWVREAISELRPQYAILENVRGHLSLGGTTVIGELVEIGYDAEWRVVSAASVGGLHQRARIIIVAYPQVLNVEKSKMVAQAIRTSLLQPRGIWGACVPSPDWPLYEPRMDRMVNGVSDWVDRVRGLGNAVVPQVAEVIGRLVIAHAHN
jgi:DNA (cytosine-5)-methyltransferase 1